MGLIKLSANGVKALKRVFYDARTVGNLLGKPVEKAYMTDLLQVIINSGFPVHSVPVHGGLVEVDTVSDLESEITRQRLGNITNG
jgi:L-glutamine-phosphate cytidylyltransferase